MKNRSIWIQTWRWPADACRTFQNCALIQNLLMHSSYAPAVMFHMTESILCVSKEILQHFPGVFTIQYKMMSGALKRLMEFCVGIALESSSAAKEVFQIANYLWMSYRKLTSTLDRKDHLELNSRSVSSSSVFGYFNHFSCLHGYSFM